MLNSWEAGWGMPRFARTAAAQIIPRAGRRVKQWLGFKLKTTQKTEAAFPAAKRDAARRVSTLVRLPAKLLIP